MQLRKNVDLGASFESLKNNLNKSKEIGRNGAEGKAFALGLLQGAVALHLAECTNLGEPETDCENQIDNNTFPLGEFVKG